MGRYGDMERRILGSERIWLLLLEVSELRKLSERDADKRESYVPIPDDWSSIRCQLVWCIGPRCPA